MYRIYIADHCCLFTIQQYPTLNTTGSPAKLAYMYLHLFQADSGV
jgi:hypothetical protein